MQVNEVITMFSYKGSSRELDNFNLSLRTSIKSLKRLTIGITALSTVTTAFVTKISSTLDPLIQLSRTTGDSIVNIQQLGYAASVTGSSFDAVQSTVKNLSKIIGDAAQNGSEDFDQLGISVRNADGKIKSATEIMAELPKVFKTLSKEQQISFAEKLGIDQSLVQTLRLTNGQLTVLEQKSLKLGVVTQKQANVIASYNDSLTTLKTAFKGISESITVALVPQLQKLTKNTINLLVTNKKLITQFIVNLSNSINKIIIAISNIISSMGKWKFIVIDVGLAIKVALSPMLRMIAIITGVVLVVDDLISAFRGAKSVIGGSAGLTPQLMELGVILGAGYIAFKFISTGVILFKNAIIALNISTKIMSATMLIFNAIINANPISLIIIAISAIILLIPKLRNEFIKLIKEFTSWASKLSWIKDIVNWFSDNKKSSVSLGVNHTGNSGTNSLLSGGTAMNKVLNSSVNNLNSNSKSNTDNRSIVNNTKIDMKIDGASPDTINNVKNVVENRQHQDASNNFSRGFGLTGEFV